MMAVLVFALQYVLGSNVVGSSLSLLVADSIEFSYTCSKLIRCSLLWSPSDPRPQPCP